MTNLTTLDSLKTYLGETSSVADAQLTQLISAYSDAVRQYTNRDWTVGSYRRLFDGKNNLRQMLPQWPIRTVTEVWSDGEQIPARLDRGQPGYFFDEMSVVLSCYRFAYGLSNIEILWTAGYDTVPLPIQQATNEWAALRYRLSDKLEWSSKSLAGESVSLIVRDMPESVKLMLNNYRAVVPL